MGGGVVDTDHELADLEGCEGLLDGFWDADAEGGDGVVCVLGEMLVGSSREGMRFRAGLWLWLWLWISLFEELGGRMLTIIA